MTYLTLFRGRKAKWLGLYRRLLARVARVPGVEVISKKTVFSLVHKDAVIGVLRVKADGIELGLALPKAAVKSRRLKPAKRKSKTTSHLTLLSEVDEIDEELLTWIKAAKHSAHA